MISKIIDNLYLADLASIQAGRGKGQIICVLENLPDVEPESALWIPIIKRKLEKVKIKPDQDYEWREYISHAIPQQLDLVADTIEAVLQNGRECTVNCAASQERSPLAIMWYLNKYKKMSLEDAFKFVKEKHPITINRLDWIPNYTKSIIE